MRAGKRTHYGACVSRSNLPFLRLSRRTFPLCDFCADAAAVGGRPLGINLPAGDDFISWCMAATAFLGLAHTFKHGEMIRVGLLIDRLNDNVRHYVEIAALLVGVGFIGFFAWHAAIMTWQSWKFADISQGVVAVPLWIPQLGYSGGLVILLIAFVDELIHVLRGFAPRYELPKPQSAEEIVERAMQSGV